MISSRSILGTEMREEIHPFKKKPILGLFLGNIFERIQDCLEGLVVVLPFLV